jgi:hypothetical protein
VEQEEQGEAGRNRGGGGGEGGGETKKKVSFLFPSHMKRRLRTNDDTEDLEVSDGVDPFCEQMRISFVTKSGDQ